MIKAKDLKSGAKVVIGLWDEVTRVELVRRDRNGFVEIVTDHGIFVKHPLEMVRISSEDGKVSS